VDRVPAAEILLVDPVARQLILESRDAELSDFIHMHEREGMQSLTRSLMELLHKEYVEPKAAYDAASNVQELKMLMKGISASHRGYLARPRSGPSPDVL
jgi:Tfp pilus assembly pilus retraction ATPase PilT